MVTDAYRHGRAAGGPQRATGKRATTEASAHQKSKRVTGVVARAAGRRRQDPSAPPVGGPHPDLRAIRTKAEADAAEQVGITRATACRSRQHVEASGFDGLEIQCRWGWELGRALGGRGIIGHFLFISNYSK